MYHAARTVAASSSSRLNSPVTWNRKSRDDYYDVESGGSSGETERTPLLFSGSARCRTRRTTSKQPADPNKVHPVALLLMLALLGLLLLGVAIGVYLLVVQIKHPWPVSYPFFLVERPAWWQYPEALHATSLDRTGVTDVVVLHTRTAPCANQTDCLRFLQQTEADSWAARKDHIPYNFLIGGDGVTYEGRGWKAQHGFEELPGRNQSLVVAMIGNFTDRQPAEVQYAELKAFLTESIRRFSLAAQYRLRGAVNESLATNDGSALFDQLQRWPHWTGFLRV
uniref:Peptidoglycan recognition protein family domain-containing protein n=1 Tax=Anopheles atroparvus TaxID=41427 RepID=A0A8W7N511_ANOAO